MKEILVLTGPTGIGKTALSIEIALEKGYEIISADSRQIYKYMNIGTGKVMPGEMKGVRHHLIDIIEPDEDYNAFNFRNDAQEIIESGKPQMMVGGTIFYIKALFESVIGAPSVEGDLKSDIEKKYNTSKEAVYTELNEKDPEAASKIHLNDKYRVVRALSVIYMTGKKYSSFKVQKESDFKPRYLVLSMDRDRLYERINKRVDSMIEAGLIQEVQNILNMGFKKELKSLNTLGYKEIVEFLNGAISKDEAVSRIKKETRNFAKRQHTLLKSLKEPFYTHDEILRIVSKY